MIDEVQYAPELFPYIKIYADSHHEPGAFWLTGSQIFQMMRGVQESLAGRAAVLSMTSLAQAELAGASMTPLEIDPEALKEREKLRIPADVQGIFERIYRGSMPAIVSGRNTNSQIFYGSYLSTYIERDVKLLSDAIDSLKFLQWENGAWFDGCCHPLHCRYDLTRLEFLIKNEAEETKPIYGAWWFFVFPIKKITKYSFPFFVRGDDVEFSYKNNLKIARMNGIGTWQEDFSLKASPMTRYLDTRSGIILQMTLPHTRTNPWKIIQLVWNFFWNPNLSYMYDSANAVVMAFADTLDGPSYWKNNMEMSAIRKKVKEKYSIESESPLSSHYEQIPLADKNIQLKIFTKALRKLTFNGHLIPSRFFKKEVERINKQQLPFYNRVFLRDKICVCDIISKKQYFLKKNTSYFVKNLTLFIYTTIKFILKYHFLKKEYNNFVKSLTPDFWNKNF